MVTVSLKRIQLLGKGTPETYSVLMSKCGYSPPSISTFHNCRLKIFGQNNLRDFQKSKLEFATCQADAAPAQMKGRVGTTWGRLYANTGHVRDLSIRGPGYRQGSWSRTPLRVLRDACLCCTSLQQGTDARKTTDPTRPLCGRTSE